MRLILLSKCDILNLTEDEREDTHMEMLELMKNRHSVRRYKEQPIEEAKCHFEVVTGREVK